MIRVVMMGGEPASGKTTLFKRLRNSLPATNHTFKAGLVRGLCNTEQTIFIIGVFDSSTFEGTDKLSMAVQPAFLRFIERLDRNQTEDIVVFLEGDRLYTPTLIASLQDKAFPFLIHVSPDTLADRHADRNDNQSSSFLKAKRTKLLNISESFDVPTFSNETPEDGQAILNHLLSYVT